MNNLEDIQSRKEDLMADFIYGLLGSCYECPAYNICEKHSRGRNKCPRIIKAWLLQESEN